MPKNETENTVDISKLTAAQLESRIAALYGDYTSKQAAAANARKAVREAAAAKTLLTQAHVALAALKAAQPAKK